MSTKPRKQGPGRPKGSSSSPSHFRVVPIWKREFDREGFVKALVLLAMHLDEQDAVVHKKRHIDNTGGEGSHA